MIDLRSTLRRLPFGRNNRGAAAVEYVLTMAISFIILMGLLELFRALAVDLLLNFISWVVPPYP